MWVCRPAECGAGIKMRRVLPAWRHRLSLCVLRLRLLVLLHQQLVQLLLLLELVCQVIAGGAPAFKMPLQRLRVVRQRSLLRR